MSDKKAIRIGMIDDHDLLREGICKFLGKYGFETIFDVDSGKSAIDKMERCEIIPDLCIVDVNMPVMNGFETTKALHEKYPELKILAFSVNDDDKDVLKMLQSGADGYLLKGADPEELKRAIEVICNGGRYFSAGVSEIAKKYFRKN